MKKILSFIVLCTMIISMQIHVNAEDVYIDTLRVGLSFGTSAKGEAWFFSESDINVFDSYYATYITTVPANTKFKIAASGGAFTSDYFTPQYASITLESASAIKYNDAPYKGKFELRISGDKITVINVINTEEYLASVLGKEMNEKWPLEALKAQAVCARNYAVTIAGKHASYGFDICATQDCQVYGGVNSEADSTRQAVEETKGIMVTYEDEVVPLYYFSCDGGYTEDSENVWVNALGYLRGKKDIYEKSEYATRYNWTIEYTKTEIEDILAKKNLNVGELLDIRIDQVSDNNGVIKLTFVGTDGEKSVTKTLARTTLSLYSQAYTIEKDKGTPIISEEPEVRVSEVLTGEGMFTVTNPQYAITSGGITKIPYGTVKVQEESPYYVSYKFNGHGWGHLVGMSQWGAYSMALEGYTYRDILNFYYTDIEFIEIVIEEPEIPVVETPTEDETETWEEPDVTEDESLEEDNADDELLPEEDATETWQEETYDDTQWSDTGI